MTPIQQLFLGTGAAAKIPYLDEVFHIDAYVGNGTTRDRTNPVDLTKGGMVWFKNLDNGNEHHRLYDSTQPPQQSGNLYSYPIFTSASYARGPGANGLKSFNSNGFSIYTDSSVNGNNNDMAAFSFRKAAGFFTVVSWTGNSSTNQTISHDLGCVPGCIMAKRTDDTGNWTVYHRGAIDLGCVPAISTMQNNSLQLNGAAGVNADNNWQEITSTSFRAYDDINAENHTYIAYLFAGGDSTASTAVNVELDGDDNIEVPSSSDFNYGTGDFTWEFWVKLNTTSGTQYMMDHSTSNNGGTFHMHGGLLRYLNPTTGTGSDLYTECGGLSPGHWHHIAASRSSGTTRIFVDGTLRTSASDTHNYPDNKVWIGSRPDGQYMTGNISNFRIIKGTALYTSSFNVPTAPLTNVTNTKLLCCQNNQVENSTVSPTQLSSNGNPEVRSESPFDDPAGLIFGKNEDQGVIKCGTYKGINSTTGPFIELGWEPQWLLIRRIRDGSGNSAGEDWMMHDTMRGVRNSRHGTGGYDANIKANGSNDEYQNGEILDVDSRGFTLRTTDNKYNGDSDQYIYIAIRQPDGQVSKEASVGTDAFAMDTGGGSDVIPNFDSGFPVELAIYRQHQNQANWYTVIRGAGGDHNSGSENNNGYLSISDSGAMSYGAGSLTMNSSQGWGKGSQGTSNVSWMWKKSAGFDRVLYRGDGVNGRAIPHNLGRVPKMIWVKTRTDGSQGWNVYHVGVNGGSSPEDYYMQSPGPDNAVNASTRWNDTAPTATHFTVGTSSRVNGSSSEYVALLFADSTVSKCGYYAGDGTSNGSHSINVGFQPRFILIKQTSGTNWKNWVALDTLRGEDKLLYFNTDAQETTSDLIDITSTGWSFKSSDELVNSNENSNNYIYYAHA